MSRLQSLTALFAVITLFLLSHPASAAPVLARPDLYRLELFADFAAVSPHADTFQLVFSSGQHGFSPGLYVTGGPGQDQQGTQLYRVDGPNSIAIVHDGFNTNMSMVFGQGAYGDGMLITAPAEARIVRLLADGTMTTFATLGTLPQGPAIMAYGPGNNLFVTDRSGGTILLVQPSGQSTVFTTPGSQPNGLINDTSGNYGSGLIGGTFHFVPTLTGPDFVFSVSSTGVVTPLATGLNGIELLTLGPGGNFGSDLFVATLGTVLNSDGAIYTLSPDGALRPFMTNIDAIHVAFDTEGILGGGMFISDLTQGAGPGKLWRVTAVPEPRPFTLVALAVLIVLGTSRGRRNVYVLKKNPQKFE